MFTECKAYDEQGHLKEQAYPEIHSFVSIDRTPRLAS
jgi:hypothetical protein